MQDTSCVFTIRSRYKELSAKERQIADFILENPQAAVHPSIEELAEMTGVSEATLVRFVRKIGYSGYQRFRIALATETVSRGDRLYESTISGSGDLERVFDNAIATLESTKRGLSRESVEKAADRLVKSSGVLIFGVGGSHVVALDALHKFLRSGLQCSLAQDFHMQLMLASQARTDQVAFVISHSGETIDTLEIAEELKRRGIEMIVLTSNPRSPLARLADICLSVAVASTSFVSEAFSARIAHAAVIDVLYVEVMKALGDSGVTHLEDMRTVIARRKI